MIRIAFAFMVIALLYPAYAFLIGGKFAIGGLVTVASFTVLATLIFGFPLFLLFRKRGWLFCPHIVFASAGIGFVCAFPFALAGVNLYMQTSFAFALIGAIHGLLFWLLGVWRNDSIKKTARAVLELPAS